MAQARVGLEQARMGQLPPVCICCGQPAARVVHHKFYYRPTWLIIARLFLGRLAWAFGTYRNVDLNVPVCARHSRRLKLPVYLTYAMLGWLGLGVVASIAGFAIGAGLEINELGGFVISIFFMPLVPFLIGLFVLEFFTPRAEYFDYKIVGFTGVAPQFAQALGQGQAASQYGAPQPQFSGPSPYKPYAGFAPAPGTAPRQGGMSPIVIGLIIAAVVVVGLMLVGGAGVAGLAILFSQMRPKEIASVPAMPDHLSAPPGLGSSPTRQGIQGGIGDLNRSVPTGMPDPFGGSPSGPPGIPTGSATKFPSTPRPGKTGDSPPSNTPSSQTPGSAVKFPSTPSSTLNETVFAFPDASGKVSKFPENSIAVTSGSQLVRGATVWGLDKILWRKAELLEDGTTSGAKVHWTGRPSVWDEVLTFDKLRLIDGAAVSTKTPDTSTTSKGTTPTSEPAKEPASTPDKPVAKSEVRTWSDFTGKFKIEAEFVSFEKGMVELKKTDGTTISISITQLSQVDVKYVFERMQNRQ